MRCGGLSDTWDHRTSAGRKPAIHSATAQISLREFVYDHVIVLFLKNYAVYI